MNYQIENYFEKTFDIEDSRFRGRYWYYFEYFLDETKIQPNDIYYYAKAIKNKITSVQNDKGITLRSDAKFFMLHNFVEMVVIPFLMDNRQDFLSDVESDIEAIINEASLNSNIQKNEGKISSHEIIKAGEKIWVNLKTMSNDSW